jgi:TPR repeat protein
VAFWRRKIRAWRAYINSVDFHNSEHWRYTQAAFWFRKAAEKGDAEAQDALGDLYDSDQGGLQDYEQAAFWYRKAADQGNSNAEYMLGNLYLEGDGVPQYDTEAAAWFRKAAEQGNADAQESLGRLYEKGQGLSKDYAEAYFWLDLAAAGKQDASDSKLAAKDRDEAASHLTPADLSREQERARKWFEAHPAKPQ